MFACFCDVPFGLRLLNHPLSSLSRLGEIKIQILLRENKGPGSPEQHWRLVDPFLPKLPGKATICLCALRQSGPARPG